MTTISRYALGALLLAACGRAPAKTSTPTLEPTPAKPALACGDEIPGVEPLLRPRGLTILGEMHGTAESPAFVGRVACALAATGQPVTIGIEVPRDEQGRIDAYLASIGDAAARRSLLAGEHWQRDYQDGRSSQAIADLVERARVLRTAGADVRVLAFDLPSAAFGPGGSTEHRDVDMAKAIADARSGAPERATVVLTGNLHARRAELPDHPDMVLMTKVLLATDPALITLDVTYGAGSMWICTPDNVCGVRTSTRALDTGPVRVDLAARPEGFDGVYAIGERHASPPAKQAP